MSLQTKLAGATHLFQSYLTAAPNVLYRMTASLLIDPKGTQHFIHQVLSARDTEDADPVLGSVDITALFPGDGEDIEIIGPYYAKRSSDARILMELASLAKVMRCLSPKLVFEFGTFIGRTTRLLAINGGDSCKVLTLDLPQEMVLHKIGESFQRAPEGSRIEQHHGDSRTFDFSPWHARCDFVWVDACHDYEFAVADTVNAFKLCKPGGWIGWHDYRHSAWWSGVTRCVREQQAAHPAIRHIRGTTIALLKVD